MKTMDKVKRKIRAITVNLTRNTALYKYLYRSYWHCLLSKHFEIDDIKDSLYFTAQPNPGAGIGHQMANWISGYWHSKKFNLEFVHIPFSNNIWEELLGFYESHVNIYDLKKKGYIIRRIPLFDEYDAKDTILIKEIIKSYRGKKVIFLAEQDQGYKKQYEVNSDLQKFFFNASSRKADKLLYNNDYYNIAVHVRRGDIMQNTEENPNLAMRYQTNEYFINAIDTALDIINTNKEIAIYLFSQGKEEEFSEFRKFKNINFCMDVDAQSSFLHMVYADCLITSKSSFSYKPALLNKNGLKICPENFWHEYPDTDDWVMLDDNGFRLEK